MQRRDVVLDTNILLLPGQHGVNIFEAIEDAMHEPYRVCVLDGTLDELNGLSSDDTKDARAASLALDILDDKEVAVLEGAPVDDALVRHAENGAVVATQDKALQERIRDAGGALLRIRQQKYATLEE